MPNEVMNGVVHVHGVWTPFECRAVMAARRRGARVVISPHGALEPWAFGHKWVKKRIAWWIYQRRLMEQADLIVVNSEQERETMRLLGLTPPVAVIANGVDFEGFSGPECLTRDRERTVLFFSRLDPKKGIPDLLEAWGRIHDRKHHLLKIQGHGPEPYRRHIVEKIAELGLPDVVMADPVFGVERWAAFEQASIFVLPSYSENFGISVAEALSAGLPVITTTSTPWGDLPSEGIGWIVDNDVGQLAEALQSALEVVGARLLAMRAKAYAYAVARFEWASIADLYLKTYEWLLGRRVEMPAWIEARRM